MIVETTFTFFEVNFKFIYNDIDTSGLGAVDEIVNRNTYILDTFTGLENKVLIDIGANIGVATIIMAKLNPKSIVYSFEPDSYIYPLLLLNIQLNNLSNVIPFNIGLSTKNEKSTLLINNKMSGAGTTYSNIGDFSYCYGQSNVISEQIQLKNFDDFINEYKIKEIELLKIDAEGCEYEILLTTPLLKERKIMNIVGEFHQFKSSNMTPQDLYLYCKKYVNTISCVLLNKMIY